ncbi:DUF6000 family protein [Dactylosporangium sp. NPDC006015]|uniref:DUF6000 family protein n=1 Tax=Dactylosporangium sp. NPDC006015 TaxID=3154576 RepID=UPI00339DD644
MPRTLPAGYDRTQVDIMSIIEHLRVRVGSPLCGRIAVHALPAPSDAELMTVIDRYVTPGGRYRKLLHGNYLRLDAEARDQFGADLATAARTITDHELGVLLDSECARSRTPGWPPGPPPPAKVLRTVETCVTEREWVPDGCARSTQVGTDVPRMGDATLGDRRMQPVPCTYA